MERTIKIPSGIEVQIEKFKTTVKGPKGSMERDFYSPLFKKDIVMKMEGDKIIVSTDSKRKKVKAMLGTIESHLKNMFEGLTDGYTAKLKIVYMHFPFTIKVEGSDVMITNFLGEKKSRKAKLLDGCKVEVKGDEITIPGINKESVGQTAANLERATRIKSRDRRVFQDGIFRTQ